MGFFVRNIIFIFILFFSQLALALDYKIFDVEISTSTHAGREQAIVLGQRKAFLMLGESIALDKSLIAKLSDEEISAMVKDLEFLDEKFSGNSYKARITYTFKKKAVDAFFKSNRKKMNEEKTLIIAVFLDKNDVILWNKRNLWQEALEKVIDESELGKKYIFPKADLQDTAVLFAEDYQKISFAHLKTLVNKYHADEVIIAMAEYVRQDHVRKHEFPIINLNLRYLKPGSSKSNSKPYVFSEEGPMDFFLHEIAKDFILHQQDLIGSIDHVKKAKTLSLEIKLKNFADWMYIRQKLVDIFGLDNVKVKTLNINLATVLVEDNEIVGEIQHLFKNSQITVSKDQDILILERK